MAGIYIFFYSLSDRPCQGLTPTQTPALTLTLLEPLPKRTFFSIQGRCAAFSRASPCADGARGGSPGQGVWGVKLPTRGPRGGPGGGVGGGAPASRVQGLQAPVGDVGAKPPENFLPILLDFDNLKAPLTREIPMTKTTDYGQRTSQGTIFVV